MNPAYIHSESGCPDCRKADEKREQLRAWLDRKPPPGTWRERLVELEQERDEQLEAGHA